MDLDINRHTRRVTLYLLLGYLASYAVFHISSYVSSAAFFFYLNEFVKRGTYLLLPLIASAAMLVTSAYTTLSKTLLRAIPFSLVRIVYFLPYFYMYNYAYGMGYDTSEALLFGLLLSVGEAIIVYILSVIVFLILRAIVRRLGGKDEFCASIEKETCLDFSDPVASAFAIISAAAFLYFLVYEIINTVGFISEYGASAKPGEIIYMIVSYLYDIALFFIHFYALAISKNRSVNMIRI